MEIFKELNDENLQPILTLLNGWWHSPENINTTDIQAMVLLIYKKGNTNDFNNYRPISLLNTLYKVFAAILQFRISLTLDPHLQATQYGFRKNKSTADAIHLIRRAIEFGESSKNQLHLVLLDWEKALAKVDRNKLIDSLDRIGIPRQHIIIKDRYGKTEFIVEIDGKKSE